MQAEREEHPRGDCMCLTLLANWLQDLFAFLFPGSSRPNSYMRGSYQAPPVVTPGVSFSRSVCAVGSSPEDERGRLLPDNAKVSQSSREMEDVEGVGLVAAREVGGGNAEGGDSTEASSFPKSLKTVRKAHGSKLSLMSDDDEDICPTCLEGYTLDNPKITTKCGHHFHLSCIYEWLERSNTCPVCFRTMSFDEFD